MVWPFTNTEADLVRSLFARDPLGDKLDHIVWRGRAEDLGVNPGDAVDLVVKTSVPRVLEYTRYVGLAWLPAGPIAKGVQVLKEGGAHPLSNVIMRPSGGELILAASSTFWGEKLVATVQAVPRGEGIVAAEKVTPPDPITEGAKSLGAVLGFGALLFFAYHLFLREVRK